MLERRIGKIKREIVSRIFTGNHIISSAIWNKWARVKFLKANNGLVQFVVLTLIQATSSPGLFPKK